MASVPDTLSRAIHAVFGEWTVLKLAVENEFAGSNTRDNALALLQRVRDGMLSSPVVHKDELEALLDDALLDDFNVEAEDESPSEVAKLLCQMHAEARAGSTATAEMVLQRMAGKSSWVEVPPPPKVRGEDDSSDDDGADDDEPGATATPSGDAMDVGDEVGGSSSSRAAPEVDEDGFQMVPSKSKRRGRG